MGEICLFNSYSKFTLPIFDKTLSNMLNNGIMSFGPCGEEEILKVRMLGRN